MKAQIGWKTGLTMVVAAWLFVSPWIVVPTTLAASLDAWIAGAVVFIVAVGSIQAPRPDDVTWLNAIAGAWLFVAPWVLGFVGTQGAAWNAWIVGAAVALLALWSSSESGTRRRAMEQRQHSG